MHARRDVADATCQPNQKKIFHIQNTWHYPIRPKTPKMPNTIDRPGLGNAARSIARWCVHNWCIRDILFLFGRNLLTYIRPRRPVFGRDSRTLFPLRTNIRPIDAKLNKKQARAKKYAGKTGKRKRRFWKKWVPHQVKQYTESASIKSFWNESHPASRIFSQKWHVPCAHRKIYHS